MPAPLPQPDPVAVRPRNPFLVPVLLWAAIIVTVYVMSPNFRFAETRSEAPFAGDFLQEWLGGYIVRCGDYGRFYEPEYAQVLQHDARLMGFQFPAHQYLPVVYPPFYYLLICPLSLLPVWLAAWVWAALMVGCLAWAMAILAGYATRRLGLFPPTAQRSATESGDNAESRRRHLIAVLPWAIPAALLFQPLLESLTSNQKGTVCLLLLTGTFVLLHRGRPLAAGMVFGLLAFKPQLTLVIAAAMLAKREWRFVGGGAITGAALAAGSLWLGSDVCWQYFDFATGTADYLGTTGYALHKSHCLYGFFALLSGGPGCAARIATLLAAAGVVYLLAQLLRGPLVPGTSRLSVQFAGLVVATVLLSPHLFTYDLTILLLPMFLLVVEIVNRAEMPATIRRWLVVCLVTLFVLPGVSVPIASATGLQLTVPAVFLLLVLAVRKAASAVGRFGATPIAPGRNAHEITSSYISGTA
jgi:hypothetical protein